MDAFRLFGVVFGFGLGFGLALAFALTFGLGLAFEGFDSLAFGFAGKY